MLTQPKRAYIEITARGQEVLASNPAKIDAGVLQVFDDYRAFLTRTKSDDATTYPATTPVTGSPPPIIAEVSSTPEEQIASASLTLDEAKSAQKGVFITTSTFSRSALQVANQPGHLRLVLINGDELTKLMVRFGVGVRIARTVEIKRIDLDYFEDTEPE